MLPVSPAPFASGDAAMVPTTGIFGLEVDCATTLEEKESWPMETSTQKAGTACLTCYGTGEAATDGTPETDQTKIAACDDDCDTLTTTDVIAAYKAIVDCATAKASAECQ